MSGEGPGHKHPWVRLYQRARIAAAMSRRPATASVSAGDSLRASLAAAGLVAKEHSRQAAAVGATMAYNELKAPLLGIAINGIMYDRAEAVTQAAIQMLRLHGPVVKRIIDSPQGANQRRAQIDAYSKDSIQDVRTTAFLLRLRYKPQMVNGQGTYSYARIKMTARAANGLIYPVVFLKIKPEDMVITVTL